MNDLDLDAQRLRASLRAKMFGVDAGPVRIGRFEVIDVVGRGGTGAVYAAYDGRLDRRVAVKILTDRGQRERILREARTLARVSHQNVIAVFEVGTVNGRVFLAMEYVEGTTVARWQIAAPRRWDEVLAIYVQAGRGLAAAHREGIVHRDFKPANLLLGADGRVRVADFGLARPTTGEETAPGASAATPSPIVDVQVADLELTQTGDLAGTPAYMAPEQVAQRPADPRSDQFSFCVALFEALFGDRPHPGRTSAEVLLSVTDGVRAVAPRRRGVPRRVRAALERGLSRRPEDRFASMDALLGELVPRRRGPRLAGAVLLVAGLGVGAAWFAARPATCDDAGAAMREAWGEPQRAAMIDAFAATGVPAASASADATARSLDRYAERWSETRHEACEAGSALLDLRIACLDRRRESFASLVAALTQADADAVHRAAEAVERLPTVRACDNDAGLRSGIRPPLPRDAAEASAISGLLGEAQAQSALGHVRDTVRVAAAAVDRARALQHPPLLAEALLELGRSHMELDDGDAARDALREAAAVAEASRHDRVAADARIALVQVHGWLHHDREAALDESRTADAAIARLGEDPVRRGELHRAVGLAHYAAGEAAPACDAFREALRQLRSELPPDDLRIARTQSNYADALAWQGDLDRALPLFDEVHAGLVTKLGESHPSVATAAFVRGLGLQAAGRPDDARADLDRALEIYRGAYGESSARVAAALEAIAKLELERGRYGAGLAPARQALEIRGELGPESDPQALSALILVGELQHALGRPEAALVPYRRALAILGDDGDAEQVALLQTNVGRALSEAGRAHEAIAAFETARRRFAAPAVSSHPARIHAELGLADALLEVGRREDAATIVERERLRPGGAVSEPVERFIAAHPQLVR